MWCAHWVYPSGYSMKNIFYYVELNTIPLSSWAINNAQAWAVMHQTAHFLSLYNCNLLVDQTIFAQNCAFSVSIFALYIKVQLHNFTLVFTKFLHKIAHLVDPSSQLALPGLSRRQVLQERAGNRNWWIFCDHPPTAKQVHAFTSRFFAFLNTDSVSTTILFETLGH